MWCNIPASTLLDQLFEADNITPIIFTRTPLKYCKIISSDTMPAARAETLQHLHPTCKTNLKCGIRNVDVFIAAQWLSGSISHFYAPRPAFKTLTRKGRFSLSSSQWFDKMSTKLAWELNNGDFASD
ncbi:hypothetical protein TNCV_2577731 [Trichonephila clavipes]|nr:hypothetical protein TNCV_2577731 [Trichonephila clavipes]